MPTRYGDTPATLIDDIGHAIAEQYRHIEDILVKKLQDAISQHLDHNADDLAAQLATIQDLRQQAEKLVGKIPPQQVADWVVHTAGDAASATITRQLLKYPRLAGNLASINAGSAYSLAAIAVELRDTLRHVNARILRAPADIYQQMTAGNIGELLAGITTHQQLQKQIRDKYLARGITGFTDKSGREWSIGAYTEMATRTAAARAWRDQALTSMQSAGISTYQVITGASTCTPCAQWTGKVLTTGTPGMQMVEHAETGEPTPFRVDATVDEWRGSGAGHPNCRCVLVMAAPGMPDYSQHTTHNPEREQQHRKLRELERKVRAAKRTGDKDAIGEAQAELRSFQRGTGIARRNYREQLPFADGGTVNPRGNTKPTPTPTIKSNGAGGKPPRKPPTNSYPNSNLPEENFTPLTREEVRRRSKQLIASEKEREALTIWTGERHRTIQRVLRGKETGTPRTLATIGRIQSVLRKNRVGANIAAYRVVSDGSPFGIADLADPDAKFSVVDQTITWSGFTSVSPRNVPWVQRVLSGKPNRQPQLVVKLLIPAELEGAYMYDVALERFKNQHELLLPDQLRVKGIAYEYDEKRNVAEATVRVLGVDDG